MNDKPTFSLGQTVEYKGRLYCVVYGSVMGVTGWRYDLEDLQGHTVSAAWPPIESRITPDWFWNLLTLDMRFGFSDYSRASGDCICEVCGRIYYKHPLYCEWLNLLCNGTLVHL